MTIKKKKPTPNKRGAPTKYKPEYCQGIIDFFTKQLTASEPELPFFSAYAREIQVNIDTLHEWKKVHANFSEAYKKCKQAQKEVLIKNGLNGGFNSTFSIFTAKNILGWRDVKEIKQDIKTEHALIPALQSMFDKTYKEDEGD